MDDRKRILAVLTVIILIGLVALGIFAVAISGRKILSPVPDEGAIRVIFISPTPIIAVTATEMVTPSPEKKATPTSTKSNITPTRASTNVPQTTSSVTPTRSAISPTQSP